MAGQELADRRADFAGVGFEREVAGIEEVDFSVGQVTLEGFGARRNEERIVLTPDRQQRRSMLAEVGLERRVGRDIRGVVQQQVELDLVSAGASQVKVVEVAAV